MTIYQGDRVTIKATWQDREGNLVNPSEHIIKIYDSTNKERFSATAPSRNPSAGVFELDYDIPEDAPVGTWRCDWEVVIEGGSKLQKIHFTVYARG